MSNAPQVLARIFVPKYPNQPVFQLEKNLAVAFNGYTLYSFGVGVWRMPNGELMQEPVYVYDVVLNESDRSTLEEILLQYKAAAEQTTVLYVFDTNPILL